MLDLKIISWGNYEKLLCRCLFSIHNDRAWVLYEPKAMLSFCTWEDWIDDISLYNKVQIYWNINFQFYRSESICRILRVKKNFLTTYFDLTIVFDKQKFLKVFNTAGPLNENKCLTEETKSREVIFFFSRTYFGPTRLTTATS